MSEPEQLKDIVTPHAHDVLSGRGNFVNHHVGNENFRSLVKRHKKEYVACPKAQKPMYSILIYDEIRSMDPPGRFLKQDPSTKLWSDIGKKKALDKTRQALREGAPEMLKELGGGDEEDDEDEEVQQKSAKRRREDNNPLNNSFMSNVSLGSFSVEGMNNPSPDLFSSMANRGMGGGNAFGFNGGGNMNMQNNQGPNANQVLMNQMQLIQQQMAQWQQLMAMQTMLQNSGAQQNLMQNSGTQLDPNIQLQLLNLQIQLQNQMGQQQQLQQQNNVPSIANQNQQGTNFNSTPTFPQMGNTNANAQQPQLNDQNVQALLAAFAANQNNPNPGPPGSTIPEGVIQQLRNQNAAPAGSTIPDSVLQQLQNQNPGSAIPANVLQQLQNQLAVQQLTQQINNNANRMSTTPTANENQNSNIANILNAAGAINGANNANNGSTNGSIDTNNDSKENEQADSAAAKQENERKPGGTSLARSQRIGLKNSFTKRPNTHRQANNLANSLMSIDGLNLDDVEESGEGEGDGNGEGDGSGEGDDSQEEGEI